MSTNITNGYLIQGITSIAALMKWLGPIKEDLRKLAADKMNRLVAEIAVDWHDRSVYLGEEIHGHEKEYSFGVCAISYFREQASVIRKTRRNDPQFDIDCEWSFIPVKKKLLAQVFASTTSYLERWAKESRVVDYAYWDNTDRDEKVSAKDWERRRQDWTWVNIPSVDGFGTDLFGRYEYPVLDKEVINSLIPSVEQRCLALANHKAQKLTISIANSNMKRTLTYTELVELFDTAAHKQRVSNLADTLSKSVRDLKPEYLWNS